MLVGQVVEARQLGNLAGPGKLLPLHTQQVIPVIAAYMLALRSSVVAGTRAQTCTTSRHRCLSACPASLPPLAMHISCIDQHAFFFFFRFSAADGPSVALGSCRRRNTAAPGVHGCLHPLPPCPPSAPASRADTHLLSHALPGSRSKFSFDAALSLAASGDTHAFCRAGP